MADYCGDSAVKVNPGIDGEGPIVIDETAKKFVTVKYLHLAAFLFFLVQAIGYGAAGGDLQVSPTAGFAGYCNSKIYPYPTCYGVWDTSPQLNIYKSINPIWLMTFFIVLAGFDHLVSFIICYKYESYAKWWLYVAGSNPLRWIEYSVSASVMAWAISILCGIQDVHLWFLIFFMNAVGMLLGQVIEALPKQDVDANEKQPFKFSSIRLGVWILAAINIFVPWLVMLCYFFKATSSPDADVPEFVYIAFLGTLVMFITFGVNSYLHNILNWYDFETAEIVYISLSFTAKTILAADVLGGLRAAGN